MDYVQTDLHEAVVSPSLDDDDNARDVMLSDDRAEAALDYLATYDYASAAHVILLLMWGTGARVGALRAVDVGDYDSDGRVLEIRHRPNTPLKNKNRGERDVALKASTCTVVDDWLANRRPDSRDDDGRRPLLASEQGRMHTTTLRAYIYGYTRPCAVGMDCPHDRDPDRCEATEYDQASRCPSSVSPHAVRRGSITHWLRSDVPRPVVSDRMQVSEDVLDEHYDERNHREKMEVRRKFLDNI